ncbi:MAG: glutamate formimidoyltransferase [Planctomycetes bacterium]|nr:glutamate formimidoyltransferase [Planctomycetota bacterium]
MIECVPNFSDGRDPAVGAALRAAITAVAGVKLLGWHSDPDHNRAVATFAGEPLATVEAARAAILCATERIDLRRHAGVHPRLGATDVCPFVPLVEGDLPACVRAAHELGERVGREFALPVYFYGAAALVPERVALPEVRRGGFEGLREALERDPARRPDAGPARLHPSAGAIAIGAREFLVAFNVNLASRDLALAKAIARAVREKDGGLPGVRALGLALEQQGCVQVSVNLCAPRRTGLRAVFALVERLAREAGVAVRSSELVGLAPRFALDAEIAREVRLPSFDARRDVLEDALEA